MDPAIDLEAMTIEELTDRAIALKVDDAPREQRRAVRDVIQRKTDAKHLAARLGVNVEDLDEKDVADLKRIAIKTTRPGDVVVTPEPAEIVAAGH